MTAEEIEADRKRAAAGNVNNQASKAKDTHSRVNTAENTLDSSDFESDDDDLIVDTWEDGGNLEKKTYEEQMANYINLIRDFCDGLEFQIKFQDPRFLKTLGKEGAGFFKLAQNCLSRERRLNSSRVESPTTWERSTASALFYRSRPCRDRNT